MLLLLSLNAAAVASDVTISGSARFKCNLLSKYMKKHGYYYISEVPYKNYKTNLFAARGAEVIIMGLDTVFLTKRVKNTAL